MSETSKSLLCDTLTEIAKDAGKRPDDRVRAAVALHLFESGHAPSTLVELYRSRAALLDTPR